LWENQGRKNHGAILVLMSMASQIQTTIAQDKHAIALARPQTLIPEPIHS